MFSLRKILASLTAFAVIFSILGQTAMAVESETPSSLDDLPYATSIDESVRASLLDNTPIINKQISFSHTPEESIITLLAEKRIFE